MNSAHPVISDLPKVFAGKTQSAHEALETAAWDEEIGKIIDSFSAFIYIKDRANRNIRVNRAVADSLGVTPQEMANTPSEQWYPETADEYHTIDRSLIASGEPILNILEPIPSHRDLNRIFVTSKFPILGNGQEVVGILVVARPTDERLDAENLDGATTRLKSQGLLGHNEPSTEPEILDVLTVIQGHVDLALFYPKDRASEK